MRTKAAMLNTKIIATLGPASSSSECLRGLLASEVRVFRLNASHGTWAEHTSNIRHLRQAADSMELDVAIFLDLQGPKIRLGRFENGGCELATGSTFTITVNNILGNAQLASTDYGDFARDVRRGDFVLLADGRVRLEVLDSDGESVRCNVVTGGPVTDRKGINLPGIKVTTPSLTEKDLVDLALGLEQDSTSLLSPLCATRKTFYVYARCCEKRMSPHVLSPRSKSQRVGRI